MGYIRHHAIIVTSFGSAYINAAHAEARRLFPYTTEIAVSPVNEYYSFLVPPDGSKEGWPESDESDANRDALIAWLDQQRCEDGSSNLDWVEVVYSHDDYSNEVPPVTVTRHTWTNQVEPEGE
jgi:hypothetical protein